MKTPLILADPEPPRFWPQVFLQPADPKPIIAPMTVGIAAICDKGNAIVVAADRLISSEANLVTEMTGRSKIIPLSPQLCVAVTGHIQDSEYVQERFEHASNLLAVQSVHAIAKRLRKTCERIREKQVEERIIRPMLGVSFQDYSRACLSGSGGAIFTDAWGKATNYRLELALLVAGIDDSGAHLYTVTNSHINSYEGIGFTSIGVGFTVAAVVLTRHGHSFKDRSIEETVYRVYEAKRAAEGTNLVGTATDMILIRRGHEARPLSPKVIEAARSIYEKMKPPCLSLDDLNSIGSLLDEPTPPPDSEGPPGSTPNPPVQPPPPGSAP